MASLHRSEPWVVLALQFSHASIPMVTHCALVQTKLSTKQKLHGFRKHQSEVT